MYLNNTCQNQISHMKINYLLYLFLTIYTEPQLTQGGKSLERENEILTEKSNLGTC